MKKQSVAVSAAHPAPKSTCMFLMTIDVVLSQVCVQRVSDLSFTRSLGTIKNVDYFPSIPEKLSAGTTQSWDAELGKLWWAQFVLRL